MTEPDLLDISQQDALATFRKCSGWEPGTIGPFTMYAPQLAAFANYWRYEGVKLMGSHPSPAQPAESQGTEYPSEAEVKEWLEYFSSDATLIRYERTLASYLAERIAGWLKCRPSAVKAGPDTKVADSYLNALLRYTGDFYASAIEHGMRAGPAADTVAHVERAARALHAMAISAPANTASLQGACVCRFPPNHRRGACAKFALFDISSLRCFGCGHERACHADNQAGANGQADAN